MLISKLMGTISAKHGFSEMKPCPTYQHLNVHTFSTVEARDVHIMPLFLPIMLFGIVSIIHLLCPKLCQIYATYAIILCLVYHSNGRIKFKKQVYHTVRLLYCSITVAST